MKTLTIFIFYFFFNACHAEELGIVYHASPVQNLTTIKSSGIHHGRNWVYATTNEGVAATYLGKWSDFDFAQGACDGEEKVTHLVERYPGAFEKVYVTKSNSSIYKLSSEGFIHNQTSFSFEVVKEDSAQVVEEIKINNPWEYLQKMNRENKVHLYYFPHRPKCVPSDDEDIIQKAVMWYREGKIGSKMALLQKHPHLKERFEKALAQSYFLE